MYKLYFHPNTHKFLKKLPKKIIKKILEKIDKLSVNPTNSDLDIKKLVNTQKSYRMRVGDIRIIYEIDTMKNTLHIWEIDYRGNIY